MMIYTCIPILTIRYRIGSRIDTCHSLVHPSFASNTIAHWMPDLSTAIDIRRVLEASSRGRRRWWTLRFGTRRRLRFAWCRSGTPRSASGRASRFPPCTNWIGAGKRRSPCPAGPRLPDRGCHGFLRSIRAFLLLGPRKVEIFRIDWPALHLGFALSTDSCFLSSPSGEGYLMLFWISALHFSAIDSFISTTGITISAITSNFDNICISIFFSKDESD